MPPYAIVTRLMRLRLSLEPQHFLQELSQMRAIVISQPGGPEVLTLVERHDPVPGPGEVLIKVSAAGVNSPDVFPRQARYAAPPGAPVRTEIGKTLGRVRGWQY